MIGVIDYGVGNIASVINAFEYLKIPAKKVSNQNEINNSSSLVLPGVGSFEYGMKVLHELGFIHSLEKHINEDKPFLGICLGMQLLFEKSHEQGEHEGLGIIPGEVVLIERTKGLFVPHVGWNDVSLSSESRILAGDENFYFVHSYACHCKYENFVKGTTNYGVQFDTVIEYENIFGTQFHPEKSHKAGFSLLEKFGNISC